MDSRERIGFWIFLVIGLLILLTYFGTAMFFITLTLLVGIWLGFSRAKRILTFLVATGGIIALFIGIGSLVGGSVPIGFGVEDFLQAGLLLGGILLLITASLLLYSRHLNAFLEYRTSRKGKRSKEVL